MATSDADGGNAAATRPTEKPKTTQIDKRLEPLEEFRTRAEGWMKEVTAQVARLASSFEHEDKKRQALENRLTDIEERIRSLLTLTELVSLDKNPFAGSPSARTNEDAAPPVQTEPPKTGTPPSVPSAQVPSQTPAAEQPQEAATPATKGEHEAEAPDQEVQNPVPAAGRPGVEVIPIDADPPGAATEEPAPDEPEEAGPLEPAPEAGMDREQDTVPETVPETVSDAEDHAEPGPDVEPGVETDTPNGTDPAGGNPEDPIDETGWAVPAPEKNPANGPTHTHHPNDAQAETNPPEPTVPPQSQAHNPTHSPANSPAHSPTHNSAVDQKTSRRLLVVAWADLLAPAAQMIDVPKFTGFYVEAEWIDDKTARLVNRLVEEIAPHTTNVGHTDVRGLHEATVRLLAEHDPGLPTFSRVDDERPEEADGERASLNAT